MTNQPDCLMLEIEVFENRRNQTDFWLKLNASPNPYPLVFPLLFSFATYTLSSSLPTGTCLSFPHGGTKVSSSFLVCMAAHRHGGVSWWDQGVSYDVGNKLGLDLVHVTGTGSTVTTTMTGDWLPHKWGIKSASFPRLSSQVPRT
jgi:hypothetical protein